MLKVYKEINTFDTGQKKIQKDYQTQNNWLFKNSDHIPHPFHETPEPRLESHNSSHPQREPR